MATVTATFFTVDNRAQTGMTMPVYEGDSALRLTDLSTNGASQIMQRSGGDWTAPADGFVCIHADAAVDVVIGDPSGLTATDGGGIPVRADTERDLSIKQGQAIAVYGPA